MPSKASSALIKPHLIAHPEGTYTALRHFPAGHSHAGFGTSPDNAVASLNQQYKWCSLCNPRPTLEVSEIPVFCSTWPYFKTRRSIRTIPAQPMTSWKERIVNWLTGHK